MIGYIKGLLLEKQPPEILIDVNGLGYQITTPMTTLYHLPNTGEEVSLWVYTLVREDALQLYGFQNKVDKNLFQSLLKINGVGAKLAITILSSMSCEQFLGIIEQNNLDQLTQIPGIGKKTGQRLLVESQHLVGQISQPCPMSPSATHFQDALKALVHLGYKEKEARAAIEEHSQDSTLSAEDLIRRGLQNILKGGRHV